MEETQALCAVVHLSFILKLDLSSVGSGVEDKISCRPMSTVHAKAHAMCVGSGVMVGERRVCFRVAAGSAVGLLQALLSGCCRQHPA